MLIEFYMQSAEPSNEDMSDKWNDINALCLLRIEAYQ